MNIKECSFCKKPTSHAEYVFTSEYTDAVICDKCVIMLCMKILVDKIKMGLFLKSNLRTYPLRIL